MSQTDTKLHIFLMKMLGEPGTYDENFVDIVRQSVNGLPSRTRDAATAKR